MHISEVKTSAPFNELFDIKEEVVEAIAKNMLENGFDAARPIVLWADKKIVIDGHTRLEAARRAGHVQIFCREFPFRDEDTALEYAIHNQRNRRNMTEAEILRCIDAVDKRRGRGATEGFRGNQYVKFDIESIIQGANSKPSNEVKAPSGAITKSAEQTAKVIGVSPRKIERARTVLSDPQEKEAVMSGKKSIHRASRDAKAKRQPKVPEPAPKPASPLPDRKPIYITIELTPLDGGYRIHVKELSWLLSHGETITGCIANLASIFNLTGEKKIMRDLSSEQTQQRSLCVVSKPA